MAATLDHPYRNRSNHERQYPLVIDNDEGKKGYKLFTETEDDARPGFHIVISSSRGLIWRTQFIILPVRIPGTPHPAFLFCPFTQPQHELSIGHHSRGADHCLI